MKQRKRSKWWRFDASERARARMRFLGKTPDGHPLWTKKEDQIVRELYPDYNAMKKRLRRRSKSSLHWRAGVLGITRQNSAWTGKEVNHLRRLWRNSTRDELTAQFPRHSWASIAMKGRIFGIRRRPWVPKPTGLDLLDKIRLRAATRKTSLTELDKICACPGYFENSGYNPKWPRRNALLNAIAALDGHVEIVWHDD